MTDEWPVSNVVELIDFCFNPLPEVCRGDMDKAIFLSFMVSSFYSFWKFRNDCLFEGKLSLLNIRRWMDLLVQEDAGALHYHSTFLVPKIKEAWTPRRQGWWKVNCDAAWVDGNVAMAVVVRDDDGLLVMDCSK